ncbi:MAG: UDP-N-acetylmuramoyl-L-alanine--D-glutamate ligase [Parvularcula sp.]|nr:UDP-N-acetylmuramoyl-L-alanine--D-glutamate ligase [Parvularcula sp.]
MTVILYGAGTEGAAAASYFAQRGIEPLLCDDNGVALPGTRAATREETLAALPGSIFLRSPGIPPTHPVVAAATRDAALATTPTGYWLLHEKAPSTFTVTGTKGKSTTTALLAALLQAGGVKTALCGNIGAPALTDPLPETEAAALEVSSYMMHDLPEADHFHIVTNLYKDHMDWHGSEAAYREAKLRPFRFAVPRPGLAPRPLIEAERLPSTVAALEDVAPLEGNRLSVGGKSLDLEALSPVWRGPSVFALRAAVAAAAQLLSTSDLLAATEDLARRWTSLPARQETVPSSDGRQWVDDPLATIPEAALSALKGFAGRKVVLLLGGADRGQDFGELIEALKADCDVTPIAFGPAGRRLPFAQAESFEDAIAMATEQCPKGGVILFSPAAPSSPPFANYKERSAVFRRAAERAQPI